MTTTAEELDYARIAREEQHEEAQRKREKKHSWQLGLFVGGRMFLGGVFIGSAVSMLADYWGTVASLQQTLVDVHRLVAGAIAFQLVAGLAIVIGLRTRTAALLTAAYLVVALLLAPPDLTEELGRAAGLATLGLVSALLMLGAHGGGRLSVDQVLRRRRKHRLNARARTGRQASKTPRSAAAPGR